MSGLTVGRCKDCGAILGVIPDGYGWAYTCPTCDKPGVLREQSTH